MPFDAFYGSVWDFDDLNENKMTVPNVRIYVSEGAALDVPRPAVTQTVYDADTNTPEGEETRALWLLQKLKH